VSDGTLRAFRVGSPTAARDQPLRIASPRPGQILCVLAELSRFCAAMARFISHCVAWPGSRPGWRWPGLMHSRRMGWQAALEYFSQTIRHEPLPEQRRC